MTFKKLLSFILLSLSVGTMAAIPSVEGLFRNGHNAEPSGELIVIKAKVTEKKELDEIPMSESSEEELKATLEENKPKESYYKFIFYYEGDQRLQLIQVGYASGKMSDSQVVSVNYIKRASDIQSAAVSTESGLFYSLLTLLGMNYRYFMRDFLKRNSQDFKENIASLNQDKLKLYESYKNYLKMTKEDESLKETMANPLKPEDPEERAKVKEILAQNMFVRQEQVKLVKYSSDFFWKVSLENMEAHFENDTHRMRDMTLTTPLGEVGVLMDDYILFDGIHELPKKLLVKAANKTSYDVRFLSTQHYTQNKRSKSMRDRYRDYQDILKELKKRPVAEEKVHNSAGMGLLIGI